MNHPRIALWVLFLSISLADIALAYWPGEIDPQILKSMLTFNGGILFGWVLGDFVSRR